MMRTQDIQKASAKARQDLDKAESDFKLSMANHLEAWAKEEQAHSIRLKEMEAEVAILKEEKKQALIPISIYKDEANRLMRSSEEAMATVKKKEEDIDQLRELLEDKLDSVGEREQDAALLAKKQATQALNIELRTNALTTQTKEINAQMRAFIAQMEQEEADLKKRKTELTLKERSVAAERESLRWTQQGLSEWAIKLKDERDVLMRIKERAKPAE